MKDKAHFHFEEENEHIYKILFSSVPKPLFTDVPTHNVFLIVHHGVHFHLSIVHFEYKATTKEKWINDEDPSRKPNGRFDLESAFDKRASYGSTGEAFFEKC